LAKTDNKLFRSQLRSKTKFATGEPEPSIDDQLGRLEEDIRRLKDRVDVFFNGASKRPPYDTKGRVETMIKRLGDDRTLSYAQRYRYGALASRYNAFRDLWRRTLQGREEGRDPVAAARVQAKQKQSKVSRKRVSLCNDAHKDVELVKQSL